MNATGQTTPGGLFRLYAFTLESGYARPPKGVELLAGAFGRSPLFGIERLAGSRVQELGKRMRTARLAVGLWLSRSSSREVGRRVPFFLKSILVGPNKGENGHHWGAYS